MSEMVVLPTRGPGVRPIEIDRLFSWPSPEFVDTYWPSAVSIQLQGTPSDDWGGIGDKPLLPSGWPDPTAYWIYDATATPAWAPAGTRYARGTFTVPPGVNRVMVYFGTDWRGELYFDGQKILTQDVDAGSWVGTTSTQVVDVTSGEHTLAAWVENDPDPELDMTHNPGGILVAVYAMDPVGTVDAFPLAHTDSSWKLIFPPSPPGMTAGEVLGIILTEAQALGYLEGWEWTFSRTLDSNGVPWDTVGDISAKVGSDYATFILDELCQTYCDVRAQPGGLVLDAYVHETLGTVQPVDLHAATDPDDPSTGNVTELTYQSQPETATSFLVRWQGGWRLVDSSPSGRKKMAVLGLGALPSEPEVDRVANGQLAHHGRQRDAITTGYHPSSVDETPYVGFRPGDTITVPARDGTPTAERVMGITVSAEGTTKVPQFALELIDILRQQWEREQTALKKMSDGTLRGDARPAQPAWTVGPTSPGPNCCPPQPADPTGVWLIATNAATFSSDEVSESYTFDVDGTIIVLGVRGDVTSSGGASFALDLWDGDSWEEVALVTSSDAAGLHADVTSLSLPVVAGDMMRFRCSSASTYDSITEGSVVGSLQVDVPGGHAPTFLSWGDGGT